MCALVNGGVHSTLELIRSIFVGRIFGGRCAVFGFIFGRDIRLFHSLSGYGSFVNGLYRTFDRISCFNISHIINLPSWKIRTQNKGKRYKHLNPLTFAYKKWLEIRVFGGLIVHARPLISLIFCLVFQVHYPCTLSTVFLPVAVLFNRNTAPFTNGFCPRHQYLCFQLWLCGQYRIAEVFAKQRVRNRLNAYAGFSVIKEQTVSSVVICTQALYQGISFVSLSPRHLREHCYHRFLLLSLQLRQACCSDRNTHRWIA